MEVRLRSYIWAVTLVVLAVVGLSGVGVADDEAGDSVTVTCGVVDTVELKIPSGTSPHSWDLEVGANEDHKLCDVTLNSNYGPCFVTVTDNHGGRMTGAGGQLEKNLNFTSSFVQKTKMDGTKKLVALYIPPPGEGNTIGVWLFQEVTWNDHADTYGIDLTFAAGPTL